MVLGAWTEGNPGGHLQGRVQGRSFVRYGRPGDDIETILPPHCRYCGIEAKNIDGEQAQSRRRGRLKSRRMVTFTSFRVHRMIWKGC